jgi:hypothetical protein
LWFSLFHPMNEVIKNESGQGIVGLTAQLGHSDHFIKRSMDGA